MRSLIRFVLAAWLSLVGAVGAYGPSYAQSDGADTLSAPPAEPQAPVGPNLQASDYAPVICDPSSLGFRYVEVRGSGFDAWATQHLVGDVVDDNGQSRLQWGSVWVSPQGRLTLEVNLCGDPFGNRPALPVGNYTVTVGPSSGQALAATSIALTPPPEPAAADDQTQPEPQPQQQTTPSVTSPNPTPAPPVIPYVLPGISAAPTPTPLPAVSIPGGTTSTSAAVPTVGPRTGPGSLQQPFPLGATGTLADGWQLAVTGVTPDAWTGIHAAVPSTIAPASDQRDYVVRVQATFAGQGTGVFSGMRLALLSGTQTTYDQLHNACGTIPDMVPPNLMTPGGSVRGNVCFTVRASDVDSLTLFDNQATETDRLYFALK
ncbi:MAG TPA: hypothetical protein VKV73_05305 [Chloroflexota bacterium]|nr:hypothetical protein [Chloroflexota bacterium]